MPVIADTTVQILGLNEADALLAEMVRRGFRSPYRSLRDIFR